MDRRASGEGSSHSPSPNNNDLQLYTGSGHPINVNGVRAFLALNFVGGIGLLLVIVTAIFSPNVKRLPTWFSFCASWIFSCISYTLLTLAGQQFTTHPSYPLCFTQAALVYAVPPL